MLGFAAFGQFAIGQLGPVNNPPLINGQRLPLYTQQSPPPVYQANLWQGTPEIYPGGGQGG